MLDFTLAAFAASLPYNALVTLAEITEHRADMVDHDLSYCGGADESYDARSMATIVALDAVSAAARATMRSLFDTDRDYAYDAHLTYFGSFEAPAWYFTAPDEYERDNGVRLDVEMATDVPF